MRPVRSLLTLFAASAALAACNDRPNTGPTAPSQLRPSFELGLLPSTCNISALRDNAKIYFAKSNDPIYKIINDLAKLPTGESATPATTDKAFDGLFRMAAVRLTTLQKPTTTPAALETVGDAFDALTKGFLGCAESWVRTDVPSVDFAPFVEIGHLYEVRGPNSLTISDEGGAYQRGNLAPYWGIEAIGGWSGQPSAKRVLIYGTPNQTLLNASGRVGSGIDLETIPIVGSVNVNVGLCAINTGTPGTDPGSRRASHEGVFGPYKTLSCSRGPSNGTALAQQSFGAGSLARRTLDFFMPQPLHAATAAFVGVVGVGAEGLSPFAVYDLSQVTLGSLGTIANGSNTTTLAVTTGIPTYGTDVVVRAMDHSIPPKPLVGVPVQMAIQGNASTIAYFRVGSDSMATVTRTTDPDGYARFDGVYLTKAGGYTLNFRVYFADPYADVVGTQILPSNPFQIQNK